MKIYMLTPNISLLKKSHDYQILENMDIKIYITPRRIGTIEELDTDESEKIIALDRDFCGWKISNEELDRIKNLKAICLQTTSFTWIDVNFLATKNIPLKGFSTEAVAEWAILIMLNLYRKVPEIINGGWKVNYDLPGKEVSGKKAGIIINRNL